MEHGTFLCQTWLYRKQLCLNAAQLTIGRAVAFKAVRSGWNKYVGPPYCRAKMYAGRVLCCSLVSHGEYADETDGRTGARRQTVMLRFSLDAASVINLRSSASDTQDTKPDVVEGVMRRAVLTWRGMQCIHVKHVVLFKQIVNAFDRWRHSNNIYDERVNECRSSGNRHQYEAAGSRPGNSRLLKTDHGRWTRVSRRTWCSGQRLRHSDVIASRPIAAQLRTVRLWTWRLTVSA